MNHKDPTMNEQDMNGNGRHSVDLVLITSLIETAIERSVNCLILLYIDTYKEEMQRKINLKNLQIIQSRK